MSGDGVFGAELGSMEYDGYRLEVLVAAVQVKSCAHVDVWFEVDRLIEEAEESTDGAI